MEERKAQLLAAAQAAREKAYAPYSHFHVGAAVMLSDGTIVQGCNVENASYGLSVCAERVALWSAVAQGRRDFVGMALVVASGSPCGACRQVMSELCPPDMPVWVQTDDGEVRRYTVAELLPDAFHPHDLGD
ncbi:MAG: cytidine deaminase [Chloroflexi bacterium]|nr:cytidine deaminase [Chloroflexota bacterium]